MRKDVVEQIRFIPGYLDYAGLDSNRDIDSLSNSDRRDVINFTSDLYTIFTNRISPIETDPDIINNYYTEEEFKFCDDNILVGNKPLFKITKQISSDPDFIRYVIICYNGIGNILAKTDLDLNRKVTQWLVDYMVKDLGEEAAINTWLFEDYWLNMYQLSK